MTKVFSPEATAAIAEFEARYPQRWMAVWRVEPFARLGSLPVAAGLIVDWTSKEEAFAAAIKSMSLRENTEETIDGITNKYISVCLEGVFVLLLRSFELLRTVEEHQTNCVTENTIESVYHFRDGHWRHIWGAPIGEFGFKAPDEPLDMRWVNSVK